MISRRIAAVTTTVVTLFLFAVAPASAANYPPGGTDDSGVGGVKTGGVGGSGSGLPNTGFDFAILGIGLAVLLLGVVLLATTRQRAVQPDA